MRNPDGTYKSFPKGKSGKQAATNLQIIRLANILYKKGFKEESKKLMGLIVFASKEVGELEDAIKRLQPFLRRDIVNYRLSDEAHAAKKMIIDEIGPKNFIERIKALRAKYDISLENAILQLFKEITE